IPGAGHDCARRRRGSEGICDRCHRGRVPAGRGNRPGGSWVADPPAGQRVTLPALMQDVHTFSRLGVLPILARTLWMFGLKRRGVRRCENDTFLPKPGPLPHTSQTEATVRSIDRVTGLVGAAT